MNSINEKKSKVSELTAKIIDKYCDPKYANRTEFIESAPYSLSGLFNVFGIDAHVDAEQLEKLALHEGISGAPRHYFLIKINDVQVELLISHLQSLVSDKALLKSFIENFPLMISEMEKIKRAAIGNNSSGGQANAGSVFYSDISLKLDLEFKNKICRQLAFHLTCAYLGCFKIKIWS